jgi:anti-sigma factor RsiW
MDSDLTHGLSDDDLADLARLADGTLPPDRRAEVEARIAASPRLASIVERQAVALAALRGTAGTGAPARLRADVERRSGRAATRRSQRRRPLLAAALAAVAAAALALAFALPGSPGGPSVADAAALGGRPATLAAPGPVAGTPQLLRADVDGVPFPNYAAKFGWRASGARKDHPSGRATTTVVYGKGGRTIAYTIVSGNALHAPSPARSTRRGGVEYRVLREDGRTVVTWRRKGRTCVLSSTRARPAELVSLAVWRGKGAIPF